MKIRHAFNCNISCATSNDLTTFNRLFKRIFFRRLKQWQDFECHRFDRVTQFILSGRDVNHIQWFVMSKTINEYDSQNIVRNRSISSRKKMTMWSMKYSRFYRRKCDQQGKTRQALACLTTLSPACTCKDRWRRYPLMFSNKLSRFRFKANKIKKIVEQGKVYAAVSLTTMNISND